MKTTTMREIGKIKLIYISDLMLEVEEKLYHGVFNVEEFIHDRCIEHNISKSVEERITYIIKYYDKRTEKEV